MAVVRGGGGVGAVGLVVSAAGGGAGGVDVVIVEVVAVEVEAGADEPPAEEGGATGAGGLALETRAVAAAVHGEEESEMRGDCDVVDVQRSGTAGGVAARLPGTRDPRQSTAC
jgi:hypothetical protein